MTKSKPIDPFVRYLSEQVTTWKEKIEGIDGNIDRYERRRAAAFQQVAYCRMKIKVLKECKDGCLEHLEAAEKQLSDINK